MPRRKNPRSDDRNSDRNQVLLEQWHQSNVAISVKTGRAAAFLGYAPSQNRGSLPYYHTSVAIQDGVENHEPQFVQLQQGRLELSSFIVDNEEHQIPSDKIVVLPRGTDSYYGVVHMPSRTEDVELTRQIFGATKDELESLVKAFGELTGRVSSSVSNAGRVTFSKTNTNTCDLTDCLIPSNFPFVAFGPTQYFWGHVSLAGFFRALSLLCWPTRPGPFELSLLERGVEADVLKRAVECGETSGNLLAAPNYALEQPR